MTRNFSKSLWILGLAAISQLCAACFESSVQWDSPEASYDLASVPAGSRVVVGGPGSTVQTGICFEIKAQLQGPNQQPFSLKSDVTLRYSLPGTDMSGDVGLSSYVDSTCSVRLDEKGDSALTRLLKAGSSSLSRYFKATKATNILFLVQVDGIDGSSGYQLVSEGATIVDPNGGNGGTVVDTGSTLDPFAGITLLVGDRSPRGYSNGAADAAQFSSPTGLVAMYSATNSSLTTYVAERGNRTIRKIVATVSGTGNTATLGGSTTTTILPTGTTLNNPRFVVKDPTTATASDPDRVTLLVSDGCTIQQVDVLNGGVTKLVGDPSDCKETDGVASAGRLLEPVSMTVSGTGLYISSSNPATGGGSIRRIELASPTRGQISTVTFSAGVNTPLNMPVKLAAQDGLIYVIETATSTTTTRLLSFVPITLGGSVNNQPVTLKGQLGVSKIYFQVVTAGPTGLLYLFNGNNFHMVDLNAPSDTSRITTQFAVPLGASDGSVSTGVGTIGNTVEGVFYEPTVSRVFFSDSGSHLVRTVVFGAGTKPSPTQISTLAGKAIPNLKLKIPTALAVSGANAYFTSSDGKLLKVNLVGTPAPTMSPVPVASPGTLNYPRAIAVDGADSVYVSHIDSGNHPTFSLIDANGSSRVIYTDTSRNSMDTPYQGIAVAHRTSAQHIYFTDQNAHVIYRAQLNAGAQMTTPTVFVGAANQPGWADGSTTAARLSYPRALVMSPDDTKLYVSVVNTSDESAIREIDIASGVVKTVAGGLSIPQNSAESGPGTSINPYLGWGPSLAVDAKYVYFLSFGGWTIRRLERSTGLVSYVPGFRNIIQSDTDGAIGGSAGITDLRMIAADGQQGSLGGLFMANLFSLRWAK
jgi:hypothetical protein